MGLKRAGFSLIELIVTIGVISISLPIFFGLYFTNIRARSSMIALTQVKSQGDMAINTMSNLIRQSAIGTYSEESGLVEVCNVGGSTSANPYFLDAYGYWFNFYLTDDNQIASRGGALGSTDHDIPLTNEVVVVNAFTIGCTNSSSFTNPLIAIRFDIDHVVNGTVSERTEERSALSYSTKIRLRN